MSTGGVLALDSLNVLSVWGYNQVNFSATVANWQEDCVADGAEVRYGAADGYRPLVLRVHRAHHTGPTLDRPVGVGRQVDDPPVEPEDFLGLDRGSR